jgi:hypothetical protein
MSYLCFPVIGGVRFNVETLLDSGFREYSAPHRGFSTVYNLDYHSVCILVRIGSPRNPSECVPPLEPKRGGQHSLADEGAGGTNSDDWREAWHSVYSVATPVLASCIRIALYLTLLLRHFSLISTHVLGSPVVEIFAKHNGLGNEAVLGLEGGRRK